MHPELAPRWRTISQAADESEIPHRTLRNWVRGGLLPVRREGRRLLVDLNVLDAVAPTLPPPRHKPLRRGLAAPPPPAGIVLSWLEVDLAIDGLRDGAEHRAGRAWQAIAEGRDADWVDTDLAARYALLAARLTIARQSYISARAEHAAATP
jgi:hypothetical protein